MACLCVVRSFVTCVPWQYVVAETDNGEVREQIGRTLGPHSWSHVCHSADSLSPEYRSVVSLLLGENEIMHFPVYTCCVALSPCTSTGLPYLHV
jgi:hypothetical protein